MSKLALFGGQPVIEKCLDWRTSWPPTSESTARKLQELYFERKWTAFSEPEGVFAEAFAKHHDSKYGIFTINGTVTLQCALGAYGVGPGDEVIVPAWTWYAAAIPAHYLGAKPVFVDVDPETLCIDPDEIEAAITERTKAIIPVHLYGSMADMDRIMAIAEAHRLRVVEDCAHAHGGIWNGRRVGSIGDVGSFSFQNSKTMTSGEGGVCITSDADIAERIFRMTHIGYGPGQAQGKASSGPPADLLCYPYRATAFQAQILSEQLPNLDSLLDTYDKAVRYLEGRLTETTRIRFQKRGRRADKQGYFGWVMLFDDPRYSDISLDVIQKAVEAEGVPLFRTWDPVYRFILFNLKPEAYRIHGECAVTERLIPRTLWLLHAYLGSSKNTLEKIADALEKVMGHADELRKYASGSAGHGK